MGGGGGGGDVSSAGEGPQYICIRGHLKLDTGTRVIVYADVPLLLHKFITIVNPLRVGRRIKFFKSRLATTQYLIRFVLGSPSVMTP